MNVGWFVEFEVSCGAEGSCGGSCGGGSRAGVRSRVASVVDLGRSCGNGLRLTVRVGRGPEGGKSLPVEEPGVGKCCAPIVGVTTVLPICSGLLNIVEVSFGVDLRR